MQELNVDHIVPLRKGGEDGRWSCPLMEAFDEEWNDDPMCKLFGPPGCWPDEKELEDMVGYKKPTLWERFLNFIGVEIED